MVQDFDVAGNGSLNVDDIRNVFGRILLVLLFALLSLLPLLLVLFLAFLLFLLVLFLVFTRSSCCVFGFVWLKMDF